MVDNSWMNEAFTDEGEYVPLGSFDDEDVEFIPIDTVVARIKSDPALTWLQMVQQVNIALENESMGSRAEQRSVAEHVESIRLGADPDRIGDDRSQTLLTQADDTEWAGRTVFDECRRELVDQAKNLHAEGFPVSEQSWQAIYELDDDGFVTAELDELGGRDHLMAQAREVDAVLGLGANSVGSRAGAPEVSVRGTQLLHQAERAVTTAHPTRSLAGSSSGIDFSRSVSANIRRQMDAITQRESQREPASEPGFDEPTAAVIDRHRREASARPASKPTQIAGPMADFFRRHGRSPVDGSLLSESDESKGKDRDDELHL